MKVSLVVAAADNGVIGRQGDLPWRLRADLRRFKALTMGHTVIVGRKTYESIRSRVGGPLPGRKMVVLTRNPAYAAPGCEVVSSMDEALRRAAGDAEVFVIGGADIYALALPNADRIYLTRVHGDVPGDTWLPPLSAEEWAVVRRERHPRNVENDYDTTFEVLDRTRAE